MRGGPIPRTRLSFEFSAFTAPLPKSGIAIAIPIQHIHFTKLTSHGTPVGATLASPAPRKRAAQHRTQDGEHGLSFNICFSRPAALISCSQRSGRRLGPA